MRTLALGLLLAACSPPSSGSVPSGSVPEEVAVSGTITALDLTAMERDGAGRLWLRTEAGEVAVEIPSGEARCPAAGLELVFELRPGDRLTVTGTRDRPDGPVVPCSADHSIRR